MTDREKDRRRLMRNNRRIRRHIEQLLIDQESWNDAHPDEPPINVDHDGMLALCLAWLDQQQRELEDDVFPLSEPSPRLAKFLEEV